MMQIRIIKTPSKGARALIRRRLGYLKDLPETIDTADAIGLVQGPMIDMVCAADIAEKYENVEAFDVKGVCPQHMTLLAIFGSTAAVQGALKEIREKLTPGSGSTYFSDI